MERARWTAAKWTLILWVAIVALAPPGLPSCWLAADPCRVHPHFSPEHALLPHTHDFLFDLALTSPPPALPGVITPIGLLLLLLSMNRILRPLSEESLNLQGWLTPPEPPPPRSPASA